MSLSELFNKMMGFPTEEDRQKERLKEKRINQNVKNGMDRMQEQFDSTIIRTVKKVKDHDIFAVRIIRQVGQNYTRIGMSVVIDCEQQHIKNEDGVIIAQW